MNGITKKYLCHHSEDELDLTLWDTHGIDIAQNPIEDEINTDLSLGVEPISIATLREILETMESKGANYIQMDYHCDHIGYDFVGVEITTANPQETEKILNKKLQKRINEFKSQRELYKSQIEILDEQIAQIESKI